MSLTFICNICRTPIEISLSDSISKDDANYNKIKEIGHSLSLRKLCTKCYQQKIKENNEKSQQINTELEKIECLKLLLQSDLSSENYKNSTSYSKNELKSKLENSLNDNEILTQDEIKLENELNGLIEQFKMLEKDEQTLLDEFKKVEKETLLVNKEYNKGRNKLTYTQNIQNDLLNDGNNMYDILFDIKINEKFGSINGNRMMYINNKINVDEINCGWGHIVFLTNLLLNKFSKYNKKILTLNYNLFPLLNYSYIQNKDQKKFMLFLSDLGPNMEMENEKINQFNEAMKEFLKIIRFLNNCILEIKSNLFNEFYEISDDSINQMSIQIILKNKSAEDNWNQCMKYLLLILKMYINALLKCESDGLSEVLKKAEGLMKI